MEENVITSSGVLAISTRLQRLSDQLRKDGQLIYQHFGVDFEPKWFPVIYTLMHRSPLSVLELANEIGYAHPSTISLLKELEKQKLIRSVADKTDSRKRLVKLTPKAQELVERMKPVWDKIVTALQTITDTNNNLMKAIAETEQELAKKSFFSRATEVDQLPTHQQVSIVDYSDRYREAFKALNLAWISKAFTVEQTDMDVLSDPEQLILQDGGAILLAVYADEVVGTCALKYAGPGVYEMTKMTVDERMRGRNIGLKLGMAIIDKGKQLKAKKIILYSNTQGSAVAVNLYKKLGFITIPLDGGVYARADIKMELEL
ncbi:bifunctional helix-turn-helix transcriptional regulator/GNAT family N-acetyltransferase [Chitinophaga pendula]|uniref:bifunctional helix-turn-helix transcriptional regulator/GNAT family N-acetyltransferase n=1 Tax=Chitinophaga TaxID=79328 RepID=UPI000BB0AF52|nr:MULTISPECIES: helix-turn-helix domain-containing GNAT family N-acetyltransferase [Chitinophaga]ASZ09531.1 MarR family transcriptional regulator [Chitinophaga sp. MD30]UCJ07535.1 bifunctional helix-turn-helix transcriptional regulator/GNAT family N-acetyltransferase [Chitinophaga pendula]